MTLKQIIKDKESNLNKIPENLITEIQKSEKEIYGRIITLLDRLQRDSAGKIIISKSNIAISADITNELKSVLNTKSYLSALREFANSFDLQAEASDKYFAKVFTGFKPSVTADAVLQKAKTVAISQLIGAPAEASFITPVAGIIDTAVSSGSSWVDLSNQIKDFVAGVGDESGKLAQHANNVAYDSFAYSDRAYTNIIAEENDAEWYLWSGRELDNSRCFCQERKGNFYHYKEIEAWGNGENIGSCEVDGGWGGREDGTNAQTIFIVAGGHRCVDSILPVSIAIVPIDVIQRVIEKGYYTPTEKEIELLGL